MQIEVTQGILDSNFDPNDPWGCAICTAIEEQLKLKRTDVQVDYSAIKVEDTWYKCSSLLAQWQVDYCESYNNSEYTDPKPIVIVFQDDMAVLIEELEE